MSRFYPTKAHAAVDFATCGLWFVGPEVFQMEWEPGSTIPPKAYGAWVALSSVLTDWGPSEKLEYGGAKLWGVKTHIVTDAIGSAAVALSPWVTGSWRRGWNYWAPQLAAASIVWWSVFTTVIPEEQR